MNPEEMRSGEGLRESLQQFYVRERRREDRWKFAWRLVLWIAAGAAIFWLCWSVMVRTF